MAQRAVRLLLLVLAACLLWAPSFAQQAEITGTVSDVNGTRVTIPLPQGPLPHVGDTVTLSQEVPGARRCCAPLLSIFNITWVFAFSPRPRFQPVPLTSTIFRRFLL